MGFGAFLVLRCCQNNEDESTKRRRESQADDMQIIVGKMCKFTTKIHKYDHRLLNMIIDGSHFLKNKKKQNKKKALFNICLVVRPQCGDGCI